MTVRPGEQWGAEVAAPDDLLVAGDDAELATHLDSGRPLSVATGDLHRTIGAPRLAVDRSPTVVRCLPLDVIRCELDEGEAGVAVAHVVARPPGPTGWWRGPIIAAMNVQYHGRWDVAPGGHPNDGRIEVIEVSPSMSWRQRTKAWRRLATGTHLPHPAITLRRLTTAEWSFEQPLEVWLDGRSRGRGRHLRVTVEPDAYRLHV